MLKKDQGYGICGAKNIYSSKVKLGNWIEDEAGYLNASMSRPGSLQYSTEQSQKYCSLNLRPEPPQLNVKIPTAAELVAKNKEGTPYSLLFNHGISEVPSQERFQTMGKLTLGSSDSIKDFALPERSLEKQKSRRNQKDLDASFKKTTEARSANAFKAEISPIMNASSTNLSSNLPVWKRQSLLTSTFPKPI